ncbi:MAG TPA: hypothetical protein PLN60_10795 [Bacillota bacterium]|nr:hypothetical protein [Bacillota bacterium]
MLAAIEIDAVPGWSRTWLKREPSPPWGHYTLVRKVKEGGGDVERRQPPLSGAHLW